MTTNECLDNCILTLRTKKTNAALVKTWHPVICLPSSSPPISPHLCSSTHRLTSQANSTCPTRLSVLWCKETATLTSASRGERKRDKGGEGEGRARHLVPFPVEGEAFVSPAGHWAFEEIACWRSVWKTLNLHLFWSQDYLALDVCRVPEHAHKNPSDTNTIFSFCMLLANLSNLAFVLLLMEVYLMFDVYHFQISCCITLARQV